MIGARSERLKTSASQRLATVALVARNGKLRYWPLSVSWSLLNWERYVGLLTCCVWVSGAIGVITPMMPDTNRAEEAIELHDLAVKLRAAILYSIAQSLAAQFPASEEPPPELQAILERLDEL